MQRSRAKIVKFSLATMVGLIALVTVWGFSQDRRNVNVELALTTSWANAYEDAVRHNPPPNMVFYEDSKFWDQLEVLKAVDLASLSGADARGLLNQLRVVEKELDQLLSTRWTWIPVKSRGNGKQLSKAIRLASALVLRILHDDGRSTSENERDLVAILDIARALASCPSTPSLDTACKIQSVALHVIRELASASSVSRSDLTKLLDYTSRSVLEDLNFRSVMGHELLWWSETISEVAQDEKPEWTLRERLAGSRLPTLRTRFVRSWDPYYYELPEDPLQWEKVVSAVGGAGDKFSESFFFFGVGEAVRDPYTRLWKEVRESALQAAVAPTRIRNEQCVTLAWLNYRLSVLTGVSRELLPTECDDCSLVVTDSEFRVAAVQPNFAPWTESGIELKTKTFVLPVSE